MLLRELVSRHVPAGQRVAVAGDPELFGDLERVCDWTPAEAWPEETTPDAVIVDLGVADALATWTARWPGAGTWLLVHPTAPEALPVGPLVASVRSQGLHLVEALALPGHHKVGLVASRDPRSLLGYLNGHEAGTPDADVASRLAWEWGLSTLVSRAREASALAEVERLIAERVALQAQLDATAAQADRHATALKQQAAHHTSQLEKAKGEAEKVRTSASYVLGQHLVGMKRHPVRATRKILADSRRLKDAKKP